MVTKQINEIFVDCFVRPVTATGVVNKVLGVYFIMYVYVCTQPKCIVARCTDNVWPLAALSDSVTLMCL